MTCNNMSSSLSRRSFPAGFVFGTASSAYQSEGAAKEGGRAPSIWDTFTHRFPGKIVDRSNGDVADDFYHRYKEDVKLMKYIGMDAFRFSISWPRVLPGGRISRGVNKEGVAFYNNLINELISNGLQPFVTIFHWDLPQALEDEYGGFLSRRIADDFKDFAGLCFKLFGDRVNYWITINEPFTYSLLGYDLGISAPGRCSAWMSNNCTGGDSATEPYVVGHHFLLCHAAAVKLYRDKYQATQKGQIGFSLAVPWAVPYSNSKSDIRAAQRFIDFTYGWFLHPVTYGDYPQSMRALVGERLPKFTPEEAMVVKGSLDFLGVNYYSTNYAANVACCVNRVNVSYSTDTRVNTSVKSSFIYPKGLEEILVYTKENYKNPTIYITENGLPESNVNGSVEKGVNDYKRIDFFRCHLSFAQKAIEKGVKVKGFLAWSFLDDFEWYNGYTTRFGINYVDYKDGLKRYPKLSAHWFKKLLQA